MKHRAGLFAAPALVAAAAALLAASAQAATTFTVSVAPGGAWSGTAVDSTVGIRDARPDRPRRPAQKISTP